MRYALIVVCFILLSGCGSKMVEPSVEIQSSIMHQDGSVVLCMTNGFQIRLMGIRVLAYDDDRTSEYRAMSRYMLHFLVTGKRLRMEYDAAKTDTSFPSGYVYADDILVNAEMVRRGYAYSVSHPVGKFDAMFQSLEREAKGNKRGLWRFEQADILTSSNN